MAKKKGFKLCTNCKLRFKAYMRNYRHEKTIRLQSKKLRPHRGSGKTKPRAVENKK